LAKIRLAYLNAEYGDLELTDTELKKCLAEAELKKDTDNILEVYNLIAINKQAMSEDKEAAKYYIKGLSMAESGNRLYYKAVFINNLGLIKSTAGQPDSALADFNTGLKISREIKNSRLVNHFLLNMCMIYVSKNEFEKASKYFSVVLTYPIPLEQASAYVNIAGAYSNIGEYEKGLAYIDSSISILALHKIQPQLSIALVNRINILTGLNRLPEAKAEMLILENWVDSIPTYELQSHFHNLKYRILVAENRHEEALEEYKIFSSYADSAREQINSKVIEGIQLEFGMQKKEIELEKEKSRTLMLEKQAEKDQMIRWMIILVVSFFVIVLLLITYTLYTRSIRKKQEQFSQMLIQSIEDERSRIARDLHDDIGQSLSFLKLKLSRKDHASVDLSDEIEQEFSKVIDQTRQISRSLYPSYIEKVGLSRAMADLAETAQQLYKVECSHEITEDIDRLPIETRTHLYRIFQECVNNTLKHSMATALKISVESKSSELEFVYMDNGQWKKENKAKPGIGVLSMLERAKMIGANISMEENTPKGFRLVLRLSNKNISI
jgi:signal transduction histidine kinase